jgi:hypothetical protein
MRYTSTRYEEGVRAETWRWSVSPGATLTSDA